MNISFDYAQLSPSLSRQRLSDNFTVSIARLAKKQMVINEDMISQLLDTPQMSPSLFQNYTAGFDAKI